MPRSILFVDDNEALRNAGRLMLELAGYSIFEAGAGYQALDLVRSHEIDLVIADMDMPDMNGAELIQTLKDSHPPLKVIAMSDWFGDNETLSGVNATLSKPFSHTDLLSVVEKTISGDSP